MKKSCKFLISILLSLNWTLQTQAAIPHMSDGTKISTATIDSTSDTLDPLFKPKFRYAIYSDFQGFKADKPNGLIQTEFYYSVYLNPKKRTKGENVNFNLARNTVFGINLTKLDDKLRYKQVNYSIDTIAGIIDTIRSIHSFDLIRYSNLNAYIKFNLFYLELAKQRFKLYFDLYGAYYSTGVRDTLLSDKEFNISSTCLGYNFRFATDFKTEESPLNLILTITNFSITSHSNNVRQRSGPLYFPEDNFKNNILDKSTIGKSKLWIYAAEFRYTSSDDADNNIFFRLSYYNNVFNVGQYKDFNNNYLQVQVGVNSTLQELFKGFTRNSTSTSQPTPSSTDGMGIH